MVDEVSAADSIVADGPGRGVPPDTGCRAGVALMGDRAATRLVPVPEVGRRHRSRRTVRLGDVDTDGLLRTDSIGRYLQDSASDDAIAAGLDNALGWVVRRTLIRIDVPAVSGEEVDLVTFCSGYGRSWAERRTAITSERGASVQAVSCWVQLDVASGRPTRLTDQFFDVYGQAAAGRTVSARPVLPPPPDGTAADGTVAERRWRFRRCDLDQFGHVNNAAQFTAVEEIFGSPRRGTVEIEYVRAVGADIDVRVVTDGRSAWLVDDTGVYTAVRWTSGDTDPP